jgi:hypothetical protein
LPRSSHSRQLIVGLLAGLYPPGVWAFVSVAGVTVTGLGGAASPPPPSGAAKFRPRPGVTGSARRAEVVTGAGTPESQRHDVIDGI